ncbi:MAG: efflux RND transporter periplasmic adaptor subunit [Ignavibacteria bacterium]|nr:efflux RND transporter periplasmic adaptor subunit [Ignavibacteria bacterium]
MKHWKSITAVIVMILVVVTILFINKQKMSATASVSIQDAYYVTVQKVERKNLSSEFNLTGTVYANNDVNILSETSGRITAVFANVGDYVQVGSVLVQVDDELRKAALISAEANFEKAKKDFERFNNLSKENSASEVQFDQAKVALAMAESQYIVAKRQFEDTKVKSPISGYLTVRNVDVGTMLQGPPAPTFVANVVDISKLKVKLNVSEKDVFHLKRGDAVKVTTDIHPNIVFPGKIESISAKADEAHTYPVEISIVNQGSNRMKAGMFARVEFKSIAKRETIVIPREALVGSIRNPQVFVLENEIAKIKNIVLGNESGKLIEVINGLEAGETLVVNGQNNLVNDTKVVVLNK